MKKSVTTLLHLAYWILYLILLAFFMLLVMATTESRTPNFFSFPFILLVFSFAIVPALICFYAYYLVLFHRFLQTRRIGRLFFWGIAAAIIAGTIGVVCISLFTPAPLFNEGLGPALYLALVSSLIGMLNGGMGLLLKGFITWYNEMRVREELDRRNYEMELSLVKSNISPHFLFNTINNIDTLIMIDAEKASLYLNQLSDIMRFMLYETKTDKIALDRELQYIEKYIALQKIRTSNEDYVRYNVTGQVESIWIEPLLLIPFIENAFKHADHRKAGNVIDIAIEAAAGHIRLFCTNSYTSGHQQKAEYGGLGNELIQRRLELLYRESYRMNITDDGNKYSVELELPWK